MVLCNNIASFSTERVNASTFAITEDDAFGEHPIIYVKIYDDPPLLVITDTGCDRPSRRSKHAAITRLRDYIERHPIPSNGDWPMNPGGGKPYCVIVTHCHYDHIRAAWQFNDPSRPDATRHPIVASALGRSFIESDLFTHSLCKYMNLPQPVYQPSIWAKDGAQLYFSKDRGVTSFDAGSQTPAPSAARLGITILNTPGHTPCELAWYDESERHLYVGDSLYHVGETRHNPPEYTGPIIFPNEGNWIDYMKSMRHLLAFVCEKNADSSVPRVKFGAGHTDIAGDAETAVSAVVALFEQIIAGKVPVLKREGLRGEENCFWWPPGSTFSVRAPTRLLDEYKAHQGREWPSHLPRKVKAGTVIP